MTFAHLELDLARPLSGLITNSNAIEVHTRVEVSGA
jgi:hypothetical protein